MTYPADPNLAERDADADVIEEVAIIGMAGRFPGADSPEALWQVIVEGRDTLTRFTPEQLAGEEPDLRAVDTDDYVRVRGVLDGVEDFDAAFFGFTPREAELLDPQHRLWLEVAWEALEASGHAAGFDGAVGVFAGGFANHYLLHSLLQNRRAVEEYVRMRRPASFAQMLSNDNSFLPTRTAYKLDLRGPAVNVQTACSTSLVAVSMAVQSLQSFESDVCIVGGVCVAVPQRTGYFYQEGAIFSRDGVCRPFDKDACGTVFSNGAGAVVLKRLADAERDGDRIAAVVKAAAVNNDGHHKVSFMAPSVEGQAEVIATAHAIADLDPATIGYIEAHGTATPMGDPIELAALTRAFRARTDKRGYCALGSVKGNIGHLDAAAGAAGLIKATLALQHRFLPPMAHFKAPNPELQLESSPFFIPAEGREWVSDGPRRAAVSSFGIGGTNAHVILEEPPEPLPSSPVTRESRIVVMSARGPEALQAQQEQLTLAVEAMVDGLTKDGAEARCADACLADLADTLGRRRRRFEHRAAVVADTPSGLAASLRKGEFVKDRALAEGARTVFMFPGQGSLVAGLAAQLCAQEAVFGNALKRLSRMASEHLGMDLWGWMADPAADLDMVLHDNARLQLSMLVFEVALFEALRDYGLTPDYLLGHSLGEWTAACVAGVLPVEQVIEAVYHRGRLMQSMPAGGAIAVRLAADHAAAYLDDDVTLAAINAPRMCLLSGSDAGLSRAKAKLADDAVMYRDLPIHVAVHSPLVDAIIDPFCAILERFSFAEPRIPILSSVTGQPLTAAEATSPRAWAEQMRHPVRFADAVAGTRAFGASVLLEVGPGQALSTLARPQLPNKQQQRAISLLAPVKERGDALGGDALRWGLSRAHCAGVSVDLSRFNPSEGRRLVALPTYPFQRARYWAEPPSLSSKGSTASLPPRVLTSRAPRRQSLLPNPGGTLDRLRRKFAQASGLSMDDLDPDTSFTDLGFDSLFLTQIADMLNEQFDVRVAFNDLAVDYNTLTKLAEHIDADRERIRVSGLPAPPFDPEAPFSGLVCLQPGDGRVPFILIHGDRANDHLAKYLPPEQPFWGYMHQGSGGERIKYRSVQSLAAHCVSEIVRALPEGPFIVGGHSYGGLVAYEVVHRLQLAGRTVRHLILLDAFHPKALVRGTPQLRHPIKGVVARQRRSFREEVCIQRAESFLRRGQAVPPIHRSGYTLSLYDRAARHYEPPSTDCPTTIFIATDNVYDMAANGWQGTITDLDCVYIEADHLSMVRSPEAFAPLGQRLVGCLQEYASLDED